MKNEELEAAKKVLKKDEGVRFTPYQDSKGLWTVGVGRLLGATVDKAHFSPDEIELFLQNDIKKHWEEACAVFGEDFLEKLEPARKIAILSLLFTLGKPKFLLFKNTIACIRAKNWVGAAIGVKNSKWAKDVDPKRIPKKGRDDRIAYMLELGIFPHEYGVLDEA